MEIATRKKETIDWILFIENQAVLNEIETLKKETSFNFDEEFKKGISGEELKKELLSF